MVNVDELEDGRLDGVLSGATISLIFTDNRPGEGPRLHRHTYDETWLIHEGRLAFVVGDAHHHAEAGDILVAPAGVAHKFTNEGPGRARLVSIHAAATIVTEWLE